MTDFEDLLYEKDGEVPSIVYITLNRPEKLNAISLGADEMTGQIQRAIQEVNEDESVKVVIFRGAGRAFASGFDLSMAYRVYGGSPDVRPPMSRRLRIDEEQITGMYRAVLGCKKVVISQAHGWCIEGGIYILQASDIAVASQDCRFCHRGQRLAFGGIPQIPLELLQGNTKKITELIITGRTITAAEAEQMGIITKAVPREDLESEVYNLAKAVALLPADAIYFGKMARRHIYETLGLADTMFMATYHTIGTALTYREDEKEHVFIRDRERLGTPAAFRKLNQVFDEALNRTKYFRSAVDP